MTAVCHIAARALALFSTLIAVFAVAPVAGSADNPYQPKPYVELTHPEWSKHAVMYQINTRQFTEEGTFAAVREQLPRLKQLGVDILWLMPIHPIGEVNRKGKLGSPYSVRDYQGVNGEFGTRDDFRQLVDAAHDLGMYVILDWVANHTAWDNPMRAAHPEWYERDWKGDFRPTPWWDWSDIIDLDYSQPGLRKAMTDAMAYWVREFDVDGYRCDVAGFVPLDFWEQARRELDAIKPVFMLAEWEMRDLHARAFDATYAWSWQETVHGIVNGERALTDLFVYYSWNESAYPPEAMRMTFTSNHDMNAHDATARQRYGEGLDAATVLSFVGEGLPLIYNGQEAGLDQTLKFFDRDPIQWREHPAGELYASLIKLRKSRTELANAPWGARMTRIYNSRPDEVFSFVRGDENGKTFVVINFSNAPQTVTFEESLFQGAYTEWFSQSDVRMTGATSLELAPWAYRVYVSKQ